MLTKIIQNLFNTVEKKMSTSKELVLVPSSDENLVSTEKSFWAVEELFVAGHVIPDTLKQASDKYKSAGVPPTKTALNLFSTFQEAAAYGQRLNRPLVILEVKPSAFVRPQLALVSPISS